MPRRQHDVIEALSKNLAAHRLNGQDHARIFISHVDHAADTLTAFALLFAFFFLLDAGKTARLQVRRRIGLGCIAYAGIKSSAPLARHRLRRGGDALAFATKVAFE